MKVLSVSRQYAGLGGLIIILIGIFLLKPPSEKTPVPDATGSIRNIQKPSHSSNMEPPNDTVKTTETGVAPPARQISIANVATTISQAIESKLGMKGEPLPNFLAISDVKTKKKSFFSYLSGLTQSSNEKIMALRSELSALNPEQLTTQERTTLARLAKTYKVKTEVASEQINQLLYKINTVPESLVLAQAANESAWGTSRFATEGNNLFGQWCFSKGCGLIPSGRPADANYEVRKFDHPQDSVDAYIRNLNSHAGYIGFRSIRHCLNSNQEEVSGRALSAGLKSYSSRGVEYIDEIRSMIRTNSLETWDQDWWGDGSDHPCIELVKLTETQKEVVTVTSDQKQQEP